MAAPASVKEAPKEPLVLTPPAEAIPTDRMYWMGVTLDAPVHTLHLGGFEFMRHHQIPVPRQDKPEVSTLTGPYRGNYKRLDSEGLARIAAAGH